MHCAEQGQAMRTPCDTTYIKDAQSPPPLTGRAAVLHVPNVMDLIPSIAARNMSLSLSTLSLSLRVRMKYRSVILVGKRKEKNRILSEMMGTTQVCLHPPSKVLGMATDASREAKNKTPAVASSSFTRDAPRTPKRRNRRNAPAV